MNERLQFKISAELKSIIGKDLITNDFVAVFELVKNSFDAKASRVDIFFDTSEDSSVPNRIVIADNGKGMSYEDIKEKWLFVAYSAKKHGKEDPGEHIYAGNKGVGRFSSDRLGRKLRVQSKTKMCNKVHVLDIDWDGFESEPERLFHSIGIEYTTQDDFLVPSNIPKPSHGVVLEILNLREAKSWHRDKMLKLKLSLINLVNPFGDRRHPFEIVLTSPYHIVTDEAVLNEEDSGNTGIVNGVIENDIFDVLKDKTTKINVLLGADGIETTLTDRGALIYKTLQKNHEFDLLVDAGFECQIYYLNRSAKLNFARRMRMPIRSFGSLFLFRNGFRVFPVGEPGDDFWKIDSRKAQGHSRHIGTRDIVGRIDINGTEEHFKEASSRDKGLVKTPASVQLYDFVQEHCIKPIEKYVVGVTWPDSLDYGVTSERLAMDDNRARIIELVTKLSSGRNVVVVEYNRDLVSIIGDRSNKFEKTMGRLFEFAENIDDKELYARVVETRERFDEVKRQHQEAIEFARKESESKAKAERMLRAKSVELVEVKHALDSTEAKANKLEKAYEEERKRSYFLTASSSRDVEQLESFLHQIIIYASHGKHLLIREMKRRSKDAKAGELKNVETALESIEKIIVTSRFATHANFRIDSAKVEGDIVEYIVQYVGSISVAYTDSISVQVEVEGGLGLKMVFTPIEVGIVLDNLIENSKKSNSSFIKFSLCRDTEGGRSSIKIDVLDDGKGLEESILDKERVFEKGFTTTRGSGLGLYNSRQYVEALNGELFLADKQPARGAHFVIKLQK